MLHGVRKNRISCGRRARLKEDLNKTGLLPNKLEIPDSTLRSKQALRPLKAKARNGISVVTPYSPK